MSQAIDLRYRKMTVGKSLNHVIYVYIFCKIYGLSKNNSKVVLIVKLCHPKGHHLHLLNPIDPIKILFRAIDD